MFGRSLDWINSRDKTFLLLQATNRLLNRIEWQNYTLDVVPGHVEYEQVEGAERDDYMLYNSADAFDRTPDNFLTLKLYDDEGILRACQCIRFEQLGELSLEAFHQVQFGRIHAGHFSKGKPADYQINPAAKQITGKTVFHGDLIVSPKHRLPAGLLETFCVMSFFLALQKWDHDYSWAYLREKHVRSSVAMRYSLLHQYPMAILWEEKPDVHFTSDWFAFNSRSDIEYLAKVTILNDLQGGNRTTDTAFPLGSRLVSPSDST